MTLSLITWNSQGEKLDTYKRLLKQGPDVLVVQEAGNLPAALEKDRNGGKEIPEGERKEEQPDFKLGHPYDLGLVEGYTCWWVGWTRTDEGKVKYVESLGNLRCSLATFCKPDLLKGQPSTVIAEPQDDPKKRKRPLMIARIGSFLVTNIHAGGYPYIAEAIRITHSRAGMKGPKKLWAVAGDFNKEPGELEAKLKTIKAMPERQYAKPDFWTRGWRTIDFVVSNCPGSSAVEEIVLDPPVVPEGTRQLRARAFVYYGPADHRMVRVRLGPGAAPKEEKKRERAEEEAPTVKDDAERAASGDKRGGKQRRVGAGTESWAAGRERAPR